MSINQDLTAVLGTAGLGGTGGGGSGDATSIQGVPVSTNTPLNGEVLTFNGSVWIPLPVSDVPLTGPLLQEVRNESGSEIVRGSAVYIDSASAGLPTIELACSLNFDCSRLLGIVTANIANNAEGTVVKSGIATTNTSTFTEGDVVYLSDSAGECVG
jgi:hypothetical protein